MGKRITQDQKRVVYERLDAGYSYRDAATAAGVSLWTVQNLVKGPQYIQTAANKEEAKLSDPIPYSQLSKEAKRAWDDFGYFQERYFGRIPIPWQQEAAEQVVAAYESSQESFEVVNCPPGSGKTMLFTHDIPAWVTVRNRAVRGQIGSSTGDLATRLTRELRKTLQSIDIIKASSKDIKAGVALDALGNLSMDYGRFRPVERDLWTADQFRVVQMSGSRYAKEATWTAYGFDQGFLGGRFDFIVWDDLVDPKKHRTQMMREQLEDDWDNLAETRLEPGGILLLQGQRLFPTDLYRYNLDKVVYDDVDDYGEPIGDQAKYHHIKFKAHYEDRCKPEHHSIDSKPYPEGCLLSPRRLKWRRLKAAQLSRNYETVYQQEDMDPGQVLVDPEWVPRCLDHDRDRLELPHDASGRITLTGPLFSVATVDPSGTAMWGIEWWVYQPATEMWWLMDLVHEKLDAPEFLGYNDLTRECYGVAVEWQNTSRMMGIPISHWVVEINAAQRYLLAYQWVRTWAAKNSVHLIPHTTSRNKTDPELGVETIAPHWEFGRIRLPYKPNSLGQRMSDKLIDEVTTYPESRYTDLVMAEWFAHFQVPNIYRPERQPRPQPRPSWMRSGGLLRNS